MLRYTKAIVAFLGTFVGMGANYLLTKYGIVIPIETQAVIVGAIVSGIVAISPKNTEKPNV